MEYRISGGWKAFCIIIVATFSIGAVYLISVAFRSSAKAPLVSLVGAIILIALAIYLYLFAMRTLLTVDKSAIKLVGVFTARAILPEDIDGYRIGEKNVFSIHVKNGGKALQIPASLERRGELIEWFKQNYEDIDARALVAETEDLLANEQFGFTREDREARLATAKKIDTAATVGGFGLFFWSLLYPRPYEIVMLVLFVVPWIGIYITWYYKGLMRLYKKKSSPYPSVVQLMGFVTLGAFISILRDYDLYGFEKNALSLSVGGMLLTTVICSIACRQTIVLSARKGLTYVCIVVMAGLYSYSLLIFSNCYFDRSEPKVWEVQVTGKRIHRGKSTSYYVSLSPWGKYVAGKEVTVSKGFYSEVNGGDSLAVYLKSGKWGVPWYFLNK